MKSTRLADWLSKKQIEQASAMTKKGEVVFVLFGLTKESPEINRTKGKYNPPWENIVEMRLHDEVVNFGTIGEIEISLGKNRGFSLVNSTSRVGVFPDGKNLVAVAIGKTMRELQIDFERWFDDCSRYKVAVNWESYK